MDRKVDDPQGNGGPCWEDYPPMMTIAQVATILQINERGAKKWLDDAGLITKLSERRRRIDKAALRAHLDTLGSAD